MGSSVNDKASAVNRYDVTDGDFGNPFDDVGAVMNNIIAKVKFDQSFNDSGGRGKPGAVIYLPPGDYPLRTQVLIDISFLRIEGSGHGFTSSSIRFNVPEDDWPDLHELWPGGSRVMVDLAGEPQGGAAFLVQRPGSPRISSVEFIGFCIDGLHFVEAGRGTNPENSYANGKTGILVADANDSFVVADMGFVYLEHAMKIYHSDALSVRSNFIAECGSCVELLGWGQACKVSDNHIGAGPWGKSISAENHGGLLVSGNNVFPRGSSSIELRGVTRSSVVGNRLHSFYPGMVVLDGGSSENLVASNHLLRDHEPWTPFIGVDNGKDDATGLVVVNGTGNTITGNHVSEVVDGVAVRPLGEKPIIFRIDSGRDNFVATNHVVSMDVGARSSDSCFEAQVDALLDTNSQTPLDVVAVYVADSSTGNTILDSGADDEIVADRRRNVVRPTPRPAYQLESEKVHD